MCRGDATPHQRRQPFPVATAAAMQGGFMGELQCPLLAPLRDQTQTADNARQSAAENRPHPANTPAPRRRGTRVRIRCDAGPTHGTPPQQQAGMQHQQSNETGSCLSNDFSPTATPTAIHRACMHSMPFLSHCAGQVAPCAGPTQTHNTKRRELPTAARSRQTPQNTTDVTCKQAPSPDIPTQGVCAVVRERYRNVHTHMPSPHRRPTTGGLLSKGGTHSHTRTHSSQGV